MPETTLEKPVSKRQSNLTRRFATTAIIAVIVSVSVITCASYYFLRTMGLQSQFDTRVAGINQDLQRRTDLTSEGRLPAALTAQWPLLRERHGISELTVLTPGQDLIWASGSLPSTTAEEANAMNKLLQNKQSEAQVIDPMLVDSGVWLEMILNRYEPVTALGPLRNNKGNLIAFLRMKMDASLVLRLARSATETIFLLVLIGHLALVYLLHSSFRRSMLMINAQERKMEQQISRLSKMLAINKDMARNMKSASSRAVELNEQFLRRVGSDLHDGPAQSIGYAVLRLDQVSRSQESKELGQEFHAVKEALDGALTEIRGISTGLVLPELDDLTLEQSLQRVVSRHGANSKVEVKQYYQNLPEQVPMPIKICAYRFIQEGLNNASRHGKAEKCRVSAHVKDNVLSLSLKDNGMGFRKSSLNQEGGHLGLMGLKDRIESLGGEFKINSELGVGTAIKVVLSLDEEN
ncbi:MAG: sensor histidine kinase [Gammaproteobacteria bacterium]|nr:sensor histidine kinase [Gammaproteobacteria bacterium]